MEWPDTLLPLNFAKGFASVGDIADSGVYRPIEPELGLEEFNDLYNSIDATNAEWLEEVCAMLKKRAASAKPADREARWNTNPGSLRDIPGSPDLIAPSVGPRN